MSSQDGRVACDSTPGHTVAGLDNGWKGVAAFRPCHRAFHCLDCSGRLKCSRCPGFTTIHSIEKRLAGCSHSASSSMV